LEVAASVLQGMLDTEGGSKVSRMMRKKLGVEDPFAEHDG
jgi:hypothetical protein